MIKRSLLALAILSVAGTTSLAQPTNTPIPTPTPLGGGVTGQAAAYVPNIPLSARASQNLGGNAGLVYAQGMEFVRFTSVNNPEAQGVNNPDFRFGRVTQEFAIGRFEVPRAVWVNFFDALVSFNQANPGNGVAWAQFPSGGRPTHIPGQEMRPVGGISWRTAAILCNWLHNVGGSPISARHHPARGFGCHSGMSGRRRCTLIPTATAPASTVGGSNR